MPISESERQKGPRRNDGAGQDATRGCKPLRILMLEDRPEDAALMVAELKRQGFEFECRRVEAESGFVAALESAPDVILADYSLPGFDAPRALDILRSRGLDVPFIVVTGSISEEAAVECLKAGAADYLIKDRLARLGTAVAQALEQARLRRERGYAVQALRESEARYRALFAASPLPKWLFDPDTLTILEVNDAAVEHFGYTHEEFNGMAMRDLCSPEEPGGLKPRTRAPVWRFEHAGVLRQRKKDGALIDVDVHTHEVLVGGRALRVAVLHDITDARAAQTVLVQEKERFQLLVESAPYAMVMIGSEGRFEFMNTKFTEYFGYELADVPNQLAWRERAYPDPSYREEVGRTWTADRQADAVPVASRTFEVTCKNGRKKAVVFYSAELTSGKVIMTLQDITQQRSLEEQLLQAQKMEVVGRLAGGVAHDFNNVLQALLTQAQLARVRGRDPDRMIEAIGRMEEEIRRGAGLTRQLLLFSRREAPKRERLDLNEVVRGSVDMLRRLVRENVSFELDLCTGRLLVEADRGQLDQVLLNLVVNASDAMLEGGELIVRTWRAGADTVWLEVKDTGHGIPEEIQSRIFEPFFTTKERGKGTGLGLAVVHGIVMGHGGKVVVESRVGGGSAFRIGLPALGPGEAAMANGEPEAAVLRGQGERVLVVEDEAAARHAFCEVLNSLGYQVTGAGSGEEAEALPALPAFDVVLTDLVLPGVAGAELAGRLRGRWPELRVILMSGYTEDEAVRRDIRQGEVRFLQKPFDMPTLAREIRAALSEI